MGTVRRGVPTCTETYITRMAEGKKPLFRDLDASENLDELEATEIESLCISCGENVSQVYFIYNAVFVLCISQ